MQFLDIALAESHSMLYFQLQRGPHRKNKKNTAQISIYSHRNSPVLMTYTWGPLGIGDSLY